MAFRLMLLSSWVCQKDRTTGEVFDRSMVYLSLQTRPAQLISKNHPPDLLVPNVMYRSPHGPVPHHRPLHLPLQHLLNNETHLPCQIEERHVLIQQPRSMRGEEDQGFRICCFPEGLLDADHQLAVLRVVEEEVGQDEEVEASFGCGAG